MDKRTKITADYVGIDLGTSSSALAIVRENGLPEIVPNADGERLTPSIVFFDEHEDVKLVGSAAKTAGDPANTVHYIKRHMDDPDYTVEIAGEEWTPAEISALILAKLKKDCSRLIGDIEDVVIAVPANFNELARSATEAAAKMAGLNAVRLVNEPTAAALYYAHTQGIQGRVMVYDLGGGTLDITVMEIVDDRIDILLSEGATHLGGFDFDATITDLLMKAYREQKGRNLQFSEYHERNMLVLSEETKKVLSKLNRVTESVGTKKNGIADIEITREDFEAATRRLITRTIMLVEQALKAIGATVDDIDDVLLVGGSTRIPMVVETLTEQFGKKPVSCGNVDECVALGAALYAHQSLQVSEVCNHSYGTLALIEDAVTGEVKVQNSIVIPKNTPIPCSMSQTYVTSEENEKYIEVEITQGEDKDPRYVDIVGTIVLEVPEGRAAGCEVTVTYSYDENQRVQAEIYDAESGLSYKIDIEYQGRGVLTDADVERKSAYLKKVRVA